VLLPVEGGLDTFPGWQGYRGGKGEALCESGESVCGRSFGFEIVMRAE